MAAVLQVKRFKALSRRRRSISDACLWTDMALLLPNGIWLQRQLSRRPFPPLTLHRINIS
jgi:hypothetical protein